VAALVDGANIKTVNNIKVDMSRMEGEEMPGEDTDS
jgi:hypothetical protein